MNQAMQNIIDQIEKQLDCRQMDFKDSSWRNNIPSEPGWYFIKTNTPPRVLKLVTAPTADYKAHTNIPKTIQQTIELQTLNMVILPVRNEEYVVYNGEATNLKSRAREHENGHPKTFCLGLSKYEVLLRSEYKWTFCYVAASTIGLPKIDKLLRIAVEQAWRAKYGWPLLCKK